MNYNSPDYKPIHEEIKVPFYKERGETIVLDMCAVVFKDEIISADGVLIIGDDDAILPIDLDNLKIASTIFSEDLEKEIVRKAYE